MQLACPNCGHAIGSPSKDHLFCSFCGHRLPQAPLQSTTEQARAAEAATLPPTPPVAATEAEPEVVGGYRLLRRLGGGGMGTVYEAEDCSSGQRVALKLIAAEFAQSPDNVERFRREGRLASAISHPRCVFVLAADEDAGRPFIVMELMPGATLADLLQQRGRLPPQEAIAKILDVIEGLQEAHRLGVVHRDVKPSNCFVDAEGRVKVGDFGLSKSLVGDARLTKTGLFLGTPLFASPEQVRGEAVDAQSDLYSLAATLYCLLTGRAPFEGGDLAVTLARIVADPVPSLRTLRPELPAELDRVVLRGLERDRQRRWRSLEQFKQALLQLVPGPQVAAPLVARLVAYLADVLILGAVALALRLTLELPSGEQARQAVHPNQSWLVTARQLWFVMALWFLYFGVAEWLWGCSPGKALFRLRVSRATVRAAPGLGRTLLRFVVFYLFISLNDLGDLSLQPLFSGLDSSFSNSGLLQLSQGLVFVGLKVVGLWLLLCTMRRRNGWRGLHELASGTRVIKLPRAARRRARGTRHLAENVARPRDLPQRVGPYAVRGALRWEDQGRVLLAEDEALSRAVLLWLRPPAAPPLGPARRECSRPTRLRWLACGRHGDWQWDAFLAPSGRSLADLVAAEGRLSWPELQPILEQLAEELATAAREGTLPWILTAGQVWVQPHGGVQFVDMPLPLGEAGDGGSASRPSQAALALLAQTAVLALEGHAPTAAASARTPVPEHAAGLVERLLGRGRSYQTVQEVRADLEAMRDRPAEVTRWRRSAQVAILAAAMSVGLGCCGLSVGMAGGLPGCVELLRLSVQRPIGQLQLRQLEVGAARDFAAGVLSPQPLDRAAAAYQLGTDLQLRDQLREQLDPGDRELHSRLEAATGLTRRIAAWVGPADLGETVGYIHVPAHFRDAVRLRVETDSMSRTARPMMAAGAIFWLTLLLALGVGGAALSRGGITFSLLGLALVRSNGHRATWLRCAWRALLVWGPPAAVLLTAIVLDLASRRVGGAGDGQRWLLWWSDVLTWASLGLLLTYPFLALCFPRRGPQDWLAGTYLVPR
jgi:hypothetical protein